MGRALLVMDSDFNRRKAVEWIGKAKDGSRVEFKGPQRTVAQNDRMWAMLTDIASQKRYHGINLTTDSWKLLFLDALKRAKNEELLIVPNLDNTGFVNLSASSSDLAKDEMSELIELIAAWAAQNDIELHDPKVTHANSNPADEPSTASSAVSADSSSLSAEDGEDRPSASSSSTLSEADWLIVAARMLWATTPANPTEESLFVLNNQRKAAAALMPEKASQDARDKAGSIYIRCKGCIQGDHSRGDTLRYIANMAGCDVSELEA